MATMETIQDTERDPGQSMQDTTNDSFLRWVLLGNAIFSALSALLFIVGAEPVAQFLGIAPAWPLIVVGLALAPFAGGVFMASQRAVIAPRAVRVILALDVAWVVGSILLLIVGWPPFTPAGKWAVALVADVVALFAILQWVGLRRMQQTA